MASCSLWWGRGTSATSSKSTPPAILRISASAALASRALRNPAQRRVSPSMPMRCICRSLTRRAAASSSARMRLKASRVSGGTPLPRESVEMVIVHGLASDGFVSGDGRRLGRHWRRGRCGRGCIGAGAGGRHRGDCVGRGRRAVRRFGRDVRRALAVPVATVGARRRRRAARLPVCRRRGGALQAAARRPRSPATTRPVPSASHRGHGAPVMRAASAREAFGAFTASGACSAPGRGACSARWKPPGRASPGPSTRAPNRFSSASRSAGWPSMRCSPARTSAGSRSSVRASRLTVSSVAAARAVACARGPNGWRSSFSRLRMPVP